MRPGCFPVSRSGDDEDGGQSKDEEWDDEDWPDPERHGAKLDSLAECYLQLRDLWPGVTPRQINEDFTARQIRRLLDAEDGWQNKRKALAKRGETEVVSDDEMISFLGC